MAKIIDKRKLKSFVEIIGELVKIEGNEWLVDDILETLEKSSSIEEIAKHAVIQNINEYCIEEKINKQATEFYDSFPIIEIKDQLISDYKKMEHERRRDDFEGFCLCMYQQVEAIVNYCFESVELKTKIKEDRNSSAFMEWDNITRREVRKSAQLLIPFLIMRSNPIKNETPYYCFSNKEDEDKYFDDYGYPIVEYIKYKEKWNFLSRCRAVLFYYYFKGELGYKSINDVYNIINELYTIRNKNHRGGKLTEYQQDNINRIQNDESKYYLKFYGFLYDYVSKVELNYNSTEFDYSPIKEITSTKSRFVLKKKNNTK